MTLTPNSPYFLGVKSATMYASVSGEKGKTAVHQLILGDVLFFQGETQGEWARFYSRRAYGWLKTASITAQRLLEVNFIDLGQGDGCHIVTPDDKIILIDAGEGQGFDGKAGDNMYRFLSWRYNLRNRKVAGIDGVTATDSNVRPPMAIDHAIISHPDIDHYYGFYNLFNDPKLDFKNIYHNGIVERSTKNRDKSKWMYDFGEQVIVENERKSYYLWDTVRTHQEMVDLINSEPNTNKYYFKTLRKALEKIPMSLFISSIIPPII